MVWGAIRREGDPSSIKESATWVYKGEGQGSYIHNTTVEYVGAGRGSYDKEVNVSYGAWRCRTCCLFLLLLLPILGFLIYWLWPRNTGFTEPHDCFSDYANWRNAWNQEKASYCCAQHGKGCGGPVYNCHAGYSNWYFGWSAHKKSWCCDHNSMGCPGTWHGSYHLETHVTHGVGHAQGRIYDCNAGFSNWKQGWSNSKQEWCCTHEKRGCMKYHCDGDASMWAAPQRQWCCGNFQKGCPQTTVSPLKCNAMCHLQGEGSKCIDRIHWTRDHVFGGKENSCELAYSKVQVECDVCRGCSIQDAGCQVHAVGKDPFDCNAALNNFFRAWSPEKKHWCCTKRGKGCEGTSPPAVDAGYGMVWKRVQVRGYWTWQAVHGHGVVSMPYDCHAGLQNWHTGWSAGKKGWCCQHQHLGCAGAHP
ncbi:unnamed protein product [Durusdinium trenchii]|uniref:Cellulase n=1 Tax=Durusdinium trenchii TaxID=1381693 RepID=A0ABP0KH26_9DINO